MEDENKLALIINEVGLEEETSNQIQNQFNEFINLAIEWKKKADILIVTDINQKKEMAEARQARLAVAKIRIEADKTRKALKENSIKYGKAVQNVYNFIENIITPIESHLEIQEKFAERYKAKIRAELKAKREIEINPYKEFIPFEFLITLETINEEKYQEILTSAMRQMEIKIKEIEEEKSKAIQREKEIEAERERQKLENERIKKENDMLKIERENQQRIIEENRIALELAEKKVKDQQRLENKTISNLEEKKVEQIKEPLFVISTERKLAQKFINNFPLMFTTDKFFWIDEIEKLLFNYEKEITNQKKYCANCKDEIENRIVCLGCEQSLGE